MARITVKDALERIQGAKTISSTEMLKSPRSSLVYKKTINKSLYVFERSGLTILAPNDNRLPPILAEYDTPVNRRKSPEMDWWLKEYAIEIANAGEQTAIPKAPAGSSEEIYISPMLDGIKWGQRGPWWNNLKYPLNGKNYYCLVGCLATAISQILYHWYKKGVKRGCLPTKAYITETNKYDVKALPGIAMFDWENMTDEAPTTSKGKKAVALLCQYVSAALEMDYTPSSSGAYMSKAAPVLKNYFGMGDAKRLEARYTTTSKFRNALIAELQKCNPVVMCGSSDESGCHAFVCDGYRSSDGFFHFNWGWNGDGDGWFALTALSPDGYDFSVRKNAIIGLEPLYLGDVNGDGRINMSDVTKVINVANSGAYDRRADVNADGKVDGEDTQLIIGRILGKNNL